VLTDPRSVLGRGKKRREHLLEEVAGERPAGNRGGRPDSNATEWPQETSAGVVCRSLKKVLRIRRRPGEGKGHSFTLGRLSGSSVFERGRLWGWRKKPVQERKETTLDMGRNRLGVLLLKIARERGVLAYVKKKIPSKRLIQKRGDGLREGLKCPKID